MSYGGGVHGLALVIDKAYKNYIKKIPKVISWAVTFAFINFAWVLFRAESFTEVYKVLLNLGIFSFKGLSGELLKQFRTPILHYIAVHLGVSTMPFNGMYYAVLYFGIAMVLICFHRNAKECAERKHIGTISAIATGILMALCIVSFSGISTFLYFNF